MGLIGTLLNTVFGGGRNAIVETAQVFRENAESAGARELDRLGAALDQHRAEFRATRSLFDTLMDAVNRLPRPALALGTIGLFVMAMVDPLWFAERMQGLALVPEPLWWLMGAVVSFYFGARHQLKGQEFQRDIARTLARVPVVIDNTKAIRALNEDGPNAALEDWRARDAS
ncbi:holin family protein [Pseudooceanicola sp. MF1-13]|uniref:holin family protein n=1 Tax=Pseudooceanicola sp. MF1-13 TaxID=3379095 RepID=UPI0038925C9F